MSKEERKCDKCNGLFYDSPNPLREGQLEHFCSKTNGLIFRKPGFPKDLSAAATKDVLQLYLSPSWRTLEYL